MQIEGSKTGLELPGIVDEVITLAEVRPKEGEPYRAFVCTTINDFGFPAKDRSGRLSMIEPAHLGRLMEKIRGPCLRCRGAPQLRAARPPSTETAIPRRLEPDHARAMDFNGADTQDAAFDLIPANTLVKVCLTIRPGGRTRGLADAEQDQPCALPQHRGRRSGGAVRPPPHLHPHRLQGAGSQ